MPTTVIAMQPSEITTKLDAVVNQMDFEYQVRFDRLIAKMVADPNNVDKPEWFARKFRGAVSKPLHTEAQLREIMSGRHSNHPYYFEFSGEWYWRPNRSSFHWGIINLGQVADAYPTRPINVDGELATEFNRLYVAYQVRTALATPR